MRASIPVVVFSMCVGTAPLVAQTEPAGQPAQQPPAPAEAPAPQPAPPPVPFPEGAKVGFVDFQRIANESIEGKAAAQKVQDLNDQKVLELADKQKALQDAQQKEQEGLTVLSDEARAQLRKDIERMQIDIERFTQDAQTDVQDLQQRLLVDFQRKVLPFVAEVGSSRGLHVVFSAEAGIVWANRGLDLTGEVITRFDAARTPQQ